MTDFETGDVGENWVQLWASQAGITANPVRRDKKGWDFCFQFQRAHFGGTPSAPLDRLAPDLTCMVQVKTTLRGSNSESVKLSNWERMVKDPFPWFFLRVELDDDGDATAAFLIHVDDAWTERVLRRLREVPVDEVDGLHKRTLDLTWRDEEPLAKPFGLSIRDRIRDVVGDLDTYVRQKVLFRSTVGYPNDSRLEVTFTTGLSRRSQDIARAVDFAIGLEKRLPISAFLINDVRFNVPRRVEEKRDLDGYIEFASSIPSIGTTTLIFADRERTRSVSLPCETFVPTLLFPNLPEEHFKVRMAHPVVSVVTSPKTLKMNLSWTIPDEEPVSLSDLATGCEVLQLLSEATVDNGVTVAYASDNGAIEIGFADAPIEPSAAVRELTMVAGHAAFVAKYFDLPQSTLVRPAQLHRQISQLGFLRGVMDRGAGRLTITVGIPGDDSLAGKRATIVLPISARIGDTVLAAVVAYSGVAKWDSATGKLTVDNGEPRFLGKWLVPVDDWEDFGHTARAQEFVRKLRNEYEIIVGPPDDPDEER